MAAILGMAAIGAWAVGTHRVSYVVTYGVSMQPSYHAGDLVLLLKSDSYELGQVAAYHGAGGRAEVLHRIVGGSANTGFVFKGDNNPSLDAVTPTAGELIGREFLHIPDGGRWISPLLSPTGLGMLGFVVAGGGIAAGSKTRRDIARGRRKKRVKGMSGGGGSWATTAVVFKAIGRLHPVLRAVAVVSVICGALGLVLGILGYMSPAMTTTTAKVGESMTFSYSAKVPRSAAYEGTTAYSPDPIFRKLAKLVDLHLDYQGEPGRIAVEARLSAENGWHKTVQLSQAKPFTANRYSDIVQLDLNALEQHAIDAGQAIGASVGAVTVGVIARVQHSDGTVFEPKVALALGPLQVTLADGAQSLRVNASNISTGGRLHERQIGLFGRNLLSATQARDYAVYLLGAGLLGAVVTGMTAARRVPLTTRAQIQRRYPHLLVPVEPMASPPGKPVVIVDTFPALVKLAEKYGQMILTWTRPDGADDFVVRDEGILYRYRILPPASPAASKASASPVAPKSTSATPPRLAVPRPETEDQDTPAEGATEPETAATAGSEPPEEPPTEPVTPAKKAPRKRATKAATPTKAPAKRAPTKRASRAKPKPVVEEPPETTVESFEDQPLPEPTIEHPSAAAHAALLTAAIEAAENEGMAPAREFEAAPTFDVFEAGRHRAEEPPAQATAEAEATPPPAVEEAEMPGSEAFKPEPPEPETPTPEAAKPETPTPEAVEPERPAQKRTGRRKSRTRKAPAVAAREAVEDLATRNADLPANSEPEPPREPIYDFLPASKRSHYPHREADEED